MLWQRKLVFSLSLIITLSSAPFAYAQALTTPVVDTTATIARINQLETQAEQRIRFLILHTADLSNATKQIESARATVLKLMTDITNDYKAQNEQYTNDTTGKVSNELKIQAKTAVAQVEFANQQAVDKLDIAMSQGKKLSQTAPTLASIPFVRTALPSQVTSSIISQKLDTPPLTAAYANTGSRPFLPVSANIGSVIYRLQNPVPVEDRVSIWQAAGLALGGFLGMQHYFVKNTKATIRVSKFSPYDEHNYTYTIASGQEIASELHVPDFLEPVTVQTIVPGNYRVSYKQVDGGQTIGYPVSIMPGTVFCFQVPRPPVQCY